MNKKQGIVPVIVICAIIAGFGVVWTATASTMLKMSYMRGIGFAFVCFGILFTVGMIVLVISSAIKAAKKSRFTDTVSGFDEEFEPSGSSEQYSAKTSEMVFCPYCGASTDTSNGVCTHCSAPLSGATEKDGFCPFCGVPAPKGYSFCRKCGKRLPLS